MEAGQRLRPSSRATIGMALPKKAPYKPNFDQIVSRVVEAGLVRKWFGDILFSSRKRGSDDTQERGAGALSLDNLQLQHISIQTTTSNGQIADGQRIRVYQRMCHFVCRIHSCYESWRTRCHITLLDVVCGPNTCAPQPLKRAILTNNVAQFSHALTPLIEIFFATNHMNPAWWLTKNQLDLLNIEQTHPGLRSIIEKGAFTVKRTKKAFSRKSVGRTLEQTINADAASRQTEIVLLTMR
ncbi:hypothetical protein Pmani_006800 [Petrolisthes manimaculis]|uniref:Uncharacterized protein n=1 Tax=Petrolisthes manimaculis TaxID=1843537 RepID=A0AAE1UKR7_9EUCA|nr:hypothetical protein Pmani_006800 [Petrolisthes manimaculis]